MKVYALIGKSGTGKSYRAMNLSRELGAEAIIDDGLLILNGQISAGISAKRQPTKIGAVKTAIFTAEDHRKSVSEKLREEKPDAVLILGTSDAMADKIAERLEIETGIDERIYIEDITSEEERETALRERRELGKHIIPVPAMQLKKQFSGYFLHPLRTYRSRRKSAALSDKSVVRPTYSYMGSFDIAEKVISDIVEIVCSQSQNVVSVSRFYVEKNEEILHIRLSVVLRYGCRITDTAQRLQWAVARETEQMTACDVEAVDIEVRGLERERGKELWKTER